MYCNRGLGGEGERRAICGPGRGSCRNQHRKLSVLLRPRVVFFIRRKRFGAGNRAVRWSLRRPVGEESEKTLAQGPGEHHHAFIRGRVPSGRRLRVVRITVTWENSVRRWSIGDAPQGGGINVWEIEDGVMAMASVEHLHGRVAWMILGLRARLGES